MLKVERSSTEDAQGGFTLVELVVVASLLMLVLGAILGVLESLTNTEHTTSTRIDDEQAARVTLAQFDHDVRSARSLVVGLSGPSATTVDLAPADGSQQIEWSFDLGPAHTLTRYRVSADQSRTPAGVLPGVVAGSFTYLDTAGQPGAWPLPGDIARCATVIQASAVVGIHPRTASQSLTVQDALHSQEAVGCS